MDGRKLREGKLVQEFFFSKVIRVHVAFPFFLYAVPDFRSKNADNGASVGDCAREKEVEMGAHRRRGRRRNEMRFRTRVSSKGNGARKEREKEREEKVLLERGGVGIEAPAFPFLCSTAVVRPLAESWRKSKSKDGANTKSLHYTYVHIGLRLCAWSPASLVHVALVLSVGRLRRKTGVGNWLSHAAGMGYGSQAI